MDYYVHDKTYSIVQNTVIAQRLFNQKKKEGHSDKITVNGGVHYVSGANTDERSAAHIN